MTLYTSETAQGRGGADSDPKRHAQVWQNQRPSTPVPDVEKPAFPESDCLVTADAVPAVKSRHPSEGLKKRKLFTTKFSQTILRNHLGFITTSAIKLCFMQRQG